MLPQGLSPGHSEQSPPRSGNSSAQTSASLHPPAALRLRCLPFTRDMGVHGLCGRVPDSAGSICLPDEAAAWPGAQVLDGKCCCCLAWVPFLQITARTNPCSRHLWGTLARSVASICAHRARCSKLIICLLDTYVFEACAVICRNGHFTLPNANSPSARAPTKSAFLYSGRVIAERA